jgi:hypothetical protein
MSIPRRWVEVLAYSAFSPWESPFSASLFGILGRVAEPDMWNPWSWVSCPLSPQPLWNISFRGASNYHPQYSHIALHTNLPVSMGSPVRNFHIRSHIHVILCDCLLSLHNILRFAHIVACAIHSCLWNMEERNSSQSFHH